MKLQKTTKHQSFFFPLSKWLHMWTLFSNSFKADHQLLINWLSTWFPGWFLLGLGSQFRVTNALEMPGYNSAVTSRQDVISFHSQLNKTQKWEVKKVWFSVDEGVKQVKTASFSLTKTHSFFNSTAASSPGIVPVKVRTSDGQYLGSTVFTYVDEDQEVFRRFITSNRLQSKFFSFLAEGLAIRESETEQDGTSKCSSECLDS